jgi:hypothetical protein
MFDFIATDIFSTDQIIIRMPPWTKTTSLIPRADHLGYENPLDIKLAGTNLIVDSFISYSINDVRIIVSMNDLYKKILAPHFAGQNRFPAVYEDLDAFVMSERKVGEIAEIILVDSIETLLEYVPPENPKRRIEPSSIVVDTRVKVPINNHYAGNIPLARRANDDYIKTGLWKIAIKFISIPGLNVYSYSETKASGYEEPEIIRGLIERDPINDFMMFSIKGVNLYSLYTNYYEGTGANSFLSILRSDIEVLKDLDYFENEKKFNVAIDFNLHPIMVAIIEAWKLKELPILSILIFVAVVTTDNKQDNNIKEAGTIEYETEVSRASKYGQILFEYLELIRKHNAVVMPEGGKTSKLLKKLIERYDLEQKDMLIPDHNEFTRHLIKLINDNFAKMTLRQRTGQFYTGIYNEQMKWSILETSQKPRRIFPIRATALTNSRSVKTFVPLDWF